MSDDLHIAERIEKEAQVSLFDAMPPAIRTAVGARAERKRGLIALVAPGLPSPLFNRALGLGVDTVATEQDVDDLVALYRRAGAKTLWIQISPATMPESVPTWLVARGFVLAERRAWVECMRGTEAPPQVDAPFDVRAVESSEAGAVGELVCKIHGLPTTLAPWLAALAGAERWRAYAAFDDNEPVAAGFLFRAENRAWLGMGGTLASRRRRGAQGALMMLRLRDAIASGCTKIASETGEPAEGESSPSLDNLLRMGFRIVGSRLNYQLTLSP